MHESSSIREDGGGLRRPLSHIRTRPRRCAYRSAGGAWEGDDPDETTHTAHHGLGACSGVGRSGTRARGPRGSADLRPPFLPGPDALRARRDAGSRLALHDPLRAPRRPREADAGQEHGAQSGGVVEHVVRRTRVRVRAAQGGPVPHRGARHRRRRQVLLRAVSRHLRPDAQGEGRRGRGSRCRTPPLPAQAAVAGLHDLLRHAGDGRGLDRPQEVRRARGRGGLQEGAGRRRAISLRLLHAGRGAGARGHRCLLAQDAERETPGLQIGPRRRHAAGDAQERRRGPRLRASRGARRRGPAHPRRSRFGPRPSRAPTGCSSPTSGR